MVQPHPTTNTEHGTNKTRLRISHEEENYDVVELVYDEGKCMLMVNHDGV